MRGVATLDVSRMRSACVQYSAAGARQVRAVQLYCIDDVMVMNIIKTVKILPDQLKNASAVPVYSRSIFSIILLSQPRCMPACSISGVLN